jgi:large subunit ribosomal protein L10
MNQDIKNQKQVVIDEIAEKFEAAVSSVVVEYRGLSVAEVTELRRALREEEVELKVYKNSMAQRACENAGFGELKDQLTGPNAIAFGKDAVAPARVLAKFAKKHKALILKGAVVEGKVVGLDTVQELSLLPNKEGMLSMLLSCLQSPVRSVALAVKAVSEAKAENGEVVEEPTETLTEEVEVKEAAVVETEVKEEAATAATK